MGKNKSVAETGSQQPQTVSTTAVVGKTAHFFKIVLWLLIAIVLAVGAVWLYSYSARLLPQTDTLQNTAPAVSAPAGPTVSIPPAIPQPEKVTEVKYVIPESVSNAINKLADKVARTETLSEQYINIKADSSAVISLGERVDQVEKTLRRLSQLSNDGALILTAAQMIKQNAAAGQSVTMEAEILKQLAAAQSDIENDINYIYNNSSRHYPSDKNLIAEFDRISRNLTAELKNQGTWKERLLRKINEYIHISGPDSRQVSNETEVLQQVKNHVDEDQFEIALEILAKPENQKLKDNPALLQWYNLTDSKLKFSKALSHVSAYALALMKTESLRNDASGQH